MKDGAKAKEFVRKSFYQKPRGEADCICAYKGPPWPAWLTHHGSSLTLQGSLPGPRRWPLTRRHIPSSVDVMDTDAPSYTLPASSDRTPISLWQVSFSVHVFEEKLTPMPVPGICLTLSQSEQRHTYGLSYLCRDGHTIQFKPVRAKPRTLAQSFRTQSSESLELLAASLPPWELIERSWGERWWLGSPQMKPHLYFQWCEPVNSLVNITLPPFFLGCTGSSLQCSGFL